MFYPRVKAPTPQAGAALVVAMLVFALVAALMVGLQRDFTLILQRGTHQVFSEQTWAYLIGARVWRDSHCKPIAAPMRAQSNLLIIWVNCGRNLRTPIHWRGAAGCRAVLRICRADLT